MNLIFLLYDDNAFFNIICLIIHAAALPALPVLECLLLFWLLRSVIVIGFLQSGQELFYFNQFEIHSV